MGPPECLGPKHPGPRTRSRLGVFSLCAHSQLCPHPRVARTRSSAVRAEYLVENSRAEWPQGRVSLRVWPTLPGPLSLRHEAGWAWPASGGRASYEMLLEGRPCRDARGKRPRAGPLVCWCRRPFPPAGLLRDTQWGQAAHGLAFHLARRARHPGRRGLVLWLPGQCALCQPCFVPAISPCFLDLPVFPRSPCVSSLTLVECRW